MRNGKNEQTKKILSNRTGDIEVPVLHEKTINHFTSESDYSESDYETKQKKRYSLPIQLNIDAFHQQEQGGFKNTSNEFSGINLLLHIH